MDVFSVFWLLGIVAAAAARSADTAGVNNILDDHVVYQPTVSSYLADIRFLYKLYEECSTKEFSPCLKKKLVVALDRVGKSTKRLSLVDGVEFTRDPDVAEAAAISEYDLETNLPRSLEDQDSTLNQMILDGIISFFKSHTLEFKLFGQERSLDEGRRRRNSLHSLLMLPLLMAGTFIPLAFGALALLAGKALIVSKLALALAAIIGLKKLVGGSSGESYQVVSVPHHGGHYKRSFDDETHQLVYGGQIQDKLQGV